eukprot:5835501-Alexandrium_andersonii.AAC.1
MSASLVGSEMCIRDSPCPQLGIGEVGNPLNCSSEPWRRRAKRGAPGAPVSYTHLTLPTICSV